MIFGAFRLGRYAMRASGSRGPKQPPQEWGWLGKTICLGVLIAIVSGMHWWRPVLIGLGVMIALTVVICLAGQAGKHAPESEPLDEAMREYGKGGRP